MTYDAQKFGARLRQLRKERNVSQDELALRAQIDRSYMGRIERGQVNITLEKVFRLANALGCNVRDLLDWDMIG